MSIEKTPLYKGTDRELIEDFIKRLRKIFKPDGVKEDHVMENLVLHEYYFRTKLYNYKLNQEQLDKLLDQFRWSLINAGDAVGMKSALCISEALTQSNLKAIHGKAGGALTEHVKRTAGIDRFQELLSGNKPKNTVITIKLYKDDKDSCIDFANEQETFYLRDVLKNITIMANDQILDEVLELHPKIDLDKIPVNYWYFKTIWNINKISEYNIHVCDVINKLMDNFPEIAFITGYVINNREFCAYIYFQPVVKQNRILSISEEWFQERSSMIVRGGYLKGCSISENKNNPGHFIIEANEIDENIMALENLIYDERIDPYGCKTTDIITTYKMFGINETCARLHEELLFTATNLSETKNISSRHYKLLSDSLLVSGDFRFATRGSMKLDSSMDPLKLIAFETPNEMIRSALFHNEISPIGDPVSASAFGELPNIGTGISKVTLYHT